MKDMQVLYIKKAKHGEGNGKPLQYSCLGNPTEEPGGKGSQKESDQTDQTDKTTERDRDWQQTGAEGHVCRHPSSQEATPSWICTDLLQPDG